MSSPPEPNFAYVAVRPDLGTSDRQSGFDLITRKHCVSLIPMQGKPALMTFELDMSGLGGGKGSDFQLYHQLEAQFVEAWAQEVDIDHVRATTPLQTCCGLVTLEFALPATADFDPIYAHRDLELDYRDAYQRGSFHWGFANWGGLALSIVIEEQCWARMLVDVFVPEEQEDGETLLHLKSFVHIDGAPPPELLTTSELEVVGNPISLGRCHGCGHPLVVNELRDGAMWLTVPCEQCRKSHLIKVNSPTEFKRSGIRFEFQ